MSPPAGLWQTIVEPYRAAEWHECIRLSRAAVNEDPHDLAARFLLASLYLRIGNPGLALLQYERLLPLAVGCGDLFRALAAQKRLDQLHPRTIHHARRYGAIHQWFISLARSSPTPIHTGAELALAPADLLRLSPERFASVAEAARVECLDLDPRDVETADGVLWVVVCGRARWYLEQVAPGLMSERNTGAGETLICPAGRTDLARLRVIPELPTECLEFDPALIIEVFGAAASAFAVATPVVPPADDLPLEPIRGSADVGLAPAASAGPADSGPAESTDATPVAPVKGAGRAERSRAVTRPVPDPIAEPMVAATAPRDRRRETRIAVSLETRIVQLGLAGTRVAPIRGVLHSLSAADLTIGFARDELLPVRNALDHQVVRVQLTLAGKTVMHFGARMVWVNAGVTAREGSETPDALFALEFLSISEPDRARIGEAVGDPLQGPPAIAA